MVRFRPGRITRRIYCDESSYTHQKYFALGAIWHEHDSNDFEKALLSTKRRFCLYDEIKWRKAPTKPGKYFEGYKALIDRFFELPDLLTGMVAAKWNGRITNPTKLALIDYLESRLRKTINTPSSSPISERKFNIWVFRSRRS